MHNMGDSENNAKISDSAYSNSCSNSQSRRSSKSTHSGSNSSGSSGYGGKPGYSSNNSNQPPEKRLKEKDAKKKKQGPPETTTVTEEKIEEEAVQSVLAPVIESLKEDTIEVVPTISPVQASSKSEPENIKTTTTPENDNTKDDAKIPFKPEASPIIITSNNPSKTGGFSCVISINDGIVMYTTSTITTSLFYPRDMWVGRSFIDFVHPKDRNVFATQITNSLAEQKKLCVNPQEIAMNTMVCRLRHYRGLSLGFGVRNRPVTFTPFMLKVSFKPGNKENTEITYLVIEATPLFTAYKTPNENISKPTPFIIRHSANGNIEFLDPASVTYLGFLPQDITNKDIFYLYHPNDLAYMNEVYESIVKDGDTLRTKPYRMLAQNGNYVKLETEWTSFINPWSKKVEFLIGKHFVLEGPPNPDVFLSSDPSKSLKLSEDDMLKAKSLKESIVKVLNETPTKPAEDAKQQMSKKCHDLATFMETLLENKPKIDGPNHSPYERDSVMLGGISPHHDHNDSKSSTETPVSYNQLNYNETLHRYFESHPAYTINEVNTPAMEENTTESKDPNTDTNDRMSSEAQTGDSGDCETKTTKPKSTEANLSASETQSVRLTESLLSKHNAVMEKELVKIHREIRCNTKGEREKISKENKQKKKEHLARCNASFQPTSVGITLTEAHIIKTKPHGVKRGSKQLETEQRPFKYHCGSPSSSKRKQTSCTTTVQPSPTVTATTSSSPWGSNHVNNMNTLYLGMGIPQHMSIVSPVTAMPGMFPMHYVSAPSQQMTSSLTDSNTLARNISSAQYPAAAMQCMMYGQAVYGTPVMYSPLNLNPQVSYPMQQNYLSQGVQYLNNLNPLSLASSNYIEACKSALTQKTGKEKMWKKEKKRAGIRAEKRLESSSESRPETGAKQTPDEGTEFQVRCKLKSREGSRSESQDVVSITVQGSSMSNSSANASNRSTADARDETKNNKDVQMRMRNSEEIIDRTDGGSSYSSFYSSFFKTESGSAEESYDPKKNSRNEGSKKAVEGDDEVAPAIQAQGKKVIRRKMESPWMQHVSVSSELIYKYQVRTKNMDEVLTCDKQKIKCLEQPSMVNEQLGQLYLDLQLEGVAAKLTLEEGITSSSSSGEDLIRNVKDRRKKREFGKLVMIYEENAPLPPPETPLP